jgi:PAS domain S-box-containing protein
MSADDAIENNYFPNRAAKILIVDDNANNLRMISDFLENQAFDLLVAEDGESGLERAQYVLPDIILLDILMPEMDGFETCRRLKAAKSTREIPVIFMTALSETEHKVKAFQAGAVDYITKPFQKEEVLARLRVHLQLRELTAGLREAKASLERTVADRTAQLVAANRKLEEKIADRNRAFESMQASEKKFKAVLNQSYQFIGLISLDGRVVEANQSALSFIGKGIADIQGKHFWDTPWCSYSPELQEKLRASVYRAAGGEFVHFEASHPAMDGTLHVFDFSLKPVLDESGRVFVLTAEGRDITELKEAGEALAASGEYLDKIINSVGDPILVKDSQHRWVLLNDAFCEFTGFPRETLLGKSDYDFFPRHEADEFWAKDEIVLKTGKENINEETVTNARGEVRIITTKKTRYIDEKGAAFIVGILRDLTEYKTIEEQLRQTSKMEAIGTLAGGVAHDFNNLMMAVIGYSELALEELSPDAPLYEDITQIKKAGENAAALTRQLLAFSRKQVIQPRVVNLNSELSQIKKMLGRIIGEDIELKIHCASDLWLITIDPILIEQVVMNLSINARDAMPKGGTLIIETSNILLDEAYASHHTEVTPGHYVMLTISDTGIGMDAETKSHIFEPFFTTKVKGKGTGLGLATVYGIVKQSGGHIWVYSEIDHGTTFKIYLPRSDTREQSEAIKKEAEAVKGGTETILVVEDDENVRTLIGKVLRPYGYTILEAPGGNQALELLDQQHVDLDLLITDVVMPEMGGRQVADAVTARYPPGIGILFMSGYTDNAIVHHGVLDADTNFLQKPFSPKGLAKKVRQVLDRKERQVQQTSASFPPGVDE